MARDDIEVAVLRKAVEHIKSIPNCMEYDTCSGAWEQGRDEAIEEILTLILNPQAPNRWA